PGSSTVAGPTPRPGTAATSADFPAGCGPNNMGSLQGNTIRIAVVEEQIRGIREQQRSHNAVAQRRFDEIDRKLDELTEVMNRGRGAYAASLLLAGAIGAAVLKLLGLAVQLHGR